MMQCLPLTHLSETDQPLFNQNLINLAKLGRCGLPVLPGVAVSPPHFVFHTLLEHLQSPTREVFEQRLEFLKSELQRVVVSAELVSVLGKRENFLLAGVRIKGRQALWQALLNRWMEELRARIWREGFSPNLSSELSAETIFFAEEKYSLVKAHFNPEDKEVEIETTERLEPAAARRIDELVLQADKKLFLPQVYQFAVFGKRVFLESLVPYTQALPGSTREEVVLPQSVQKQLIKSAVKVFLNLSQGFSPARPDGAILEGEKIADFETAVFKISQAALSLPGQPVIYRLPDVVDGEVRGTLRLIHQKSLLTSSCKLFNFVRHARNLLNVELGVPLTRSVEEYLQLKRELSAEGIFRKGTLKFWLELGTPENFINIGKYLEAGFDGAIINLDYLQKCLGGFDPQEAEHYRKETQGLITFLEPYLKVLHKARVPVLVKGLTAFDSEILHFLVEKGVWGVVANSPLEADNLPEHLNWVEKRVISQRLS